MVLQIVKKGDKVKVDYTGTFDDGTVFDASSKHGKPLEFTAGAGDVIKGFDDAVIGMKKGDEKQIKILPKDGYGEPDERMIIKIPKEKVPASAKPGMMLIMGAPNGEKMPVKIAKILDKEVVVDANHPMAGKALNFKIKVVDISSAQ
ncbi:MAG: peptidylprolyl isomerase [Candidatus Aenigmatarchaeota archaeon]